MSEFVLQARGLSKIFTEADAPITVFNELDLAVEAGQRIAIIGRSGSGKSTLLHLLGGLDKPTSGEVRVDGKDLSQLSQKALSRLRNQQLGFIYQFHHLLPEFTALENVSLPLTLGGVSVPQAQAKAQAILERAGLGERLRHKVAQLSGGERQRVAIARALVTEPACVLADEPTGNLDGQTAEQVFAMMLELNQAQNTSLVIVTHDEQLAQRLDVVYTLQEGRLVR
jgi:lipoprotein-releasing system ATP-binding protein